MVAFFKSLSKSSSGFHLWHGVNDSGYCGFIAKMLDKVPSSLRLECFVLQYNAEKSFLFSITVGNNQNNFCNLW